MPRFVLTLMMILSSVLTSTVSAQGPTREELIPLNSKFKLLKNMLKSASADSTPEVLLNQSDLCLKAADWIIRHKEFYDKTYLNKTLQVLQLGELRLKEYRDVKQLEDLMLPGKKFVWAYRSMIDDSLQPVAISLPVDYNTKQRWPLHIVLHGRNAKLNEVSFIDQHNAKDVSKDQTWIQVDVFGRTNNAYRWAGEADVFEALAFTRKYTMVDDQRVILWGFSMGGAGAWHIGLHHPGKFAAVGAGAGFADTYTYQKIAQPFPEPVNSLLNIYDAKPYATNLACVPFVTYGGELDPQLLASNTMQTQADLLGVPLKKIVGKQVAHKFEPTAEKEFQAFLKEYSDKGRPLPTQAKSLRFTTYTTKYNQCDWLTIEELDEPYKQALVEGEINADRTLVELTTTNVRAIEVMRDVAEKITIDGNGPFPLAEAAEGRLPGVYFTHDGTAWNSLEYNQSRDFEENKETHKRHNLQGPVDDAFTTPFVCVSPTGTPWDKSHAAWADFQLTRFSREYDKYLRGYLPIIKDSEVIEQTIADHNLILFGDPSSNSQLAKIIQQLPITWTKEQLIVNGKEFNISDHGVCLIYPNPLNKNRYVVINSGHTMHADDFEGTNALLYPRIGDVGVIKFTPQKENTFAQEIVFNDIFTTDWNWKGHGGDK